MSVRPLVATLEFAAVTALPKGESLAQIRAYRPTDRESVYDICLRTGDNGDDATAEYTNRELLGSVYAGAYVDLRPELAFVLDDGDRAIGYVLGADDTLAFEAECETAWWPGLRERFPLGSEREDSADAAMIRLIHRPEVTPAKLASLYPAHLHIDILPAGQGVGLGGALIRRLLAELTERGVPAVHLGVSAANTRAIGFYEHLGFERLGAESGVPAHESVFGMRLQGLSGH